MNLNGETYFKVNNLWLKYQVKINPEHNSNFFRFLNKEFNDVIKLIQKNPEDFGLDKEWKGEKEEEYNNKYLDKEGFLVGDQCCSEYAPELFDILKAEKDKNILFHVKRGFAGNTRVVCSQIYHSAKVLTNVRISNDDDITVFYLNEKRAVSNVHLFSKLEELGKGKIKDQWKRMSKNYKDKSFKNFMRKKFEFVFVCLWENKQEFNKDNVSIIAKLALVRLKRQMDKLNVPLHFCIIQKKKQNNRQ